jgi:hypothetical protein
MIDQASANRTGQHGLEIRMRARYHLNTDPRAPEQVDDLESLHLQVDEDLRAQVVPR